jgi:hypothetical protein
MGQYYKIVNVTKREFLHPHKFGDGLKLQEFGNSSSGTMFGLATLLSSGDGQGGGDLHSNSNLVGSWAGDSIVVLGDYSEEVIEVPGLENPKRKPLNQLMEVKKNRFKDISEKIIEAIAKASPGHPLAYVHQISKGSGWCHRPAAYGVSNIFTQPEEKNIVSFSKLMKVVDCQFGETDDITAGNFIWKLQNLYGFFSTIDPEFKNLHGSRMEIINFEKHLKLYNPLFWSADEYRFKDTINPTGPVKQYVNRIDMTIKNEKTNLEYKVELSFPCSLMDLKAIHNEVLFICKPQEQVLKVGG